ncbi:hypothetical protein AC1031_002615 [Aphanomyces cochlioides]|nr:hypothetical protein AC1031_002615 [Aphanomyces cochlioides]
MSASKKTGNDTASPLQLPTYWDELVAVFGDKRGLGDVDFGSENPNELDDGYEVDDSSDDIDKTLKRKLDQQVEADKQHNQRKRSKAEKTSVAEGLATLGSTLAKGLVEAASIQRNTGDAQILDFMRDVKASLDQNRIVQEQLLKLLQERL